jgi:hypothetical protein
VSIVEISRVIVVNLQAIDNGPRPCPGQKGGGTRGSCSGIQWCVERRLYFLEKTRLAAALTAELRRCLGMVVLLGIIYCTNKGISGQDIQPRYGFRSTRNPRLLRATRGP